MSPLRWSRATSYSSLKAMSVKRERATASLSRVSPGRPARSATATRPTNWAYWRGGAPRLSRRESGGAPPGGVRSMAGGNPRHCPVRPPPVEIARGRGHEQVEAQVAIRRPGADLVRDVERRRRYLEMRHHRAAFLAQAGLVEPAHEPPVEQGGRAEDLVDGG